MDDLLKLVGVVLVWVLVQRLLLPRLGVPT